MSSSRNNLPVPWWSVITDNGDIEAIEKVLKSNFPIDEIKSCFHDDLDHCECRKPNPGNILNAAEKYNIDLANLYYIGDSIVDIETGKNLNCTSLGVNTGELDLESMLESRTDLDTKVYSNLTELIQSNF